MGGFKPSRADIAGSTIVGSDLTTDTHQFTGSVDITGSLTLNGASITGGGGGGGAVSTYTNSGNDRVITSVNSNTINGEANLTFNGTSLTSPQVTASVSMKTAALEISSSANGALFRIDHETQSGPEPILFVSGSGLIGIGTDNPLASTPGDDTNRLHIVGNNGAEQNERPVVNTQLVLENDNHAGLQFMFPSGRSGQITWGIPGTARKAVHYYSTDNNRYTWEGDGFGDKRIMTMIASGDSINIGKSNSSHMLTNKASLHISSSTGGNDVGGPVLLRVDHADQPDAAPTLFVTGSGRVGIGTDSVLANLHVSSSDTGDLFRVDHNDNSDNPIFVVTGSGRVGIGTATPSAVFDVDPDNPAGSNSIRFKGSSQATLFNYSAGEHIYLRGGKTTSTIFIGDVRTTDGSSNQKTIIGNAASTSAKLHVSSSDTPTVMNVTSNSGSILTALENQRVGIGTNAPQQTLSVSGSAAFSGAFGSTMVETITDHLQVSATTGLTIIDASSSLAVNNTLFCSIANGTFVGQQKNIRGMIISGSSLANSTGIMITGSNIDTYGNYPLGTIALTGSNPGAGPLFQRAGCQLVWSGTKWLPVGNFNFNINGTGRQF